MLVVLPKAKHTYFIQMGKRGPIKIGTAFDVYARLTSLQTSSPSKLRIVGYVEKNVEKHLHEMFASHRIRGEWFRPHREIVRYIKKYARQTDEPNAKTSGGSALVAVSQQLESVADVQQSIANAISEQTANAGFSKPLLTIPEVEAITGMSYPTLYRKWTTGNMPKPLKLGHRTKRFRVSDIEKWVEGGCKSVRSTPKLAK